MDESGVRESWAWLVGTVLVGALVLYGAWSAARTHERLGREIQTVEHASKAGGQRTP